MRFIITLALVMTLVACIEASSDSQELLNILRTLEARGNQKRDCQGDGGWGKICSSDADCCANQQCSDSFLGLYKTCTQRASAAARSRKAELLRMLLEN